jgi:hypothetical protein
MEYTFRQLTSKDIFPMSKIISKIGIKEFKECFESDAVKALVKKAGKDKEADTSAVGFTIVIDIAGVILSHLPDCEKDIFNFLASVTGLKVSEIENASMADFAEMIIELVKKEDFKDFIGVVSRLFK